MLEQRAGCRRAAIGVLLALMTMGLACGGDGSTSSAPTTAAGSSPSSTTTAHTTRSSSSSTAGAGAPPTAARTTAPSSDTTLAPTRTKSTKVIPAGTAAALGFGEVAFKVRRAAGGAATYCALLAETEQQHQRGLMGRRDLAGYDAMIFRFVADSSAAFYMRNVPVGLSIAWFTADGRLVSSADMAPCADQEGCPTYAPSGAYRLAIEVLQGGLGALGVTEDAVLTVDGPCAS